MLHFVPFQQWSFPLSRQTFIKKRKSRHQTKPNSKSIYYYITDIMQWYLKSQYQFSSLLYIYWLKGTRKANVADDGWMSTSQVGLMVDVRVWCTWESFYTFYSPFSAALQQLLVLFHDRWCPPQRWGPTTYSIQGQRQVSRPPKVHHFSCQEAAPHSTDSL